MVADLKKPCRQRSFCCCRGSWDAAVVHLCVHVTIRKTFSLVMMMMMVMLMMMRLIVVMLSLVDVIPMIFTSRYFGVAGQGSPNSPELISMLHDWLPSHLGEVFVKFVTKMIVVIMIIVVIVMSVMIVMNVVIMVEEVGRFSIFSGFAINWEEEEAVKRISAPDYLVSLFRGKEASYIL